MKKLIAIVFAVCALGVFMSGCSKGEDASAGTTGDATKTEGK